MSAIIESETRFPGLPVSAPEKTPCTRMLDDVVPKSVTDATLACIASTAKYGTPESLRIQVESAVRWACIDAYYAGKADERREFGEGYLQGLADIERAIRGGVKS